MTKLLKLVVILTMPFALWANGVSKFTFKLDDNKYVIKCKKYKAISKARCKILLGNKLSKLFYLTPDVPLVSLDLIDKKLSFSGKVIAQFISKEEISIDGDLRYGKVGERELYNYKGLLGALKH